MRFREWLFTIFGTVATAFLAGLTDGGLKATFAIMCIMFAVVCILVTIESIRDITITTIHKENRDA